MNSMQPMNRMSCIYIWADMKHSQDISLERKIRYVLV